MARKKLQRASNQISDYQQATFWMRSLNFRCKQCCVRVPSILTTVASMWPNLIKRSCLSAIAEISDHLARPQSAVPLEGVRIYFGIFFRFVLGFFFRFSSGPAKCRILQHFLAKLTHFTLARQHPQHRFQHPPHVRPTSLASPTNRG